MFVILTFWALTKLSSVLSLVGNSGFGLIDLFVSP
jgi:hypothetical protein